MQGSAAEVPGRRPSATLIRSKGSNATYHPTPNICVEGGRIEFIKSPSEGSNLASLNPPTGGCFDKRIKQRTLSLEKKQCATTNEATNTLAHEIQNDPNNFPEEKCDIAKEFLEARIKELQKLLESEQKSVQRERLTVTRLQRQLARRDAIQRDVDRERRLRTDTESRLRDTVTESERYRATLAGLQREFSKMEDSVRSMLQYKSRCELLNQEKVFLTAAYESRIHQYQNTVTKLGQENESLKQQVRLLEEATGTEELPDALLDRLRTLETENAHLSNDADFQRKQYERCLDDIANQVVRALLSQKGLREEISNLQRRIKELENQNAALANILVNKLEGKESTIFALPPTTNGESLELSSWIPGNFSLKNASLSTDTTATTTKESSAASSPSAGITASSEERKHLPRLHSGDLGALRDRHWFRSLNSVESMVVGPLQRPKSLNLQVQTSPKAFLGVSTTTDRRSQHKKIKQNTVSASKKSTEDEGNESPESGNRDEGYSTMSSDIQGPGETNELSKRELEDLKEASDETDVILETKGDLPSVAVVEDVSCSDRDVFFIPLNLTLSINPRHSYPPNKDFLPFQQTTRCFSDSHLCLKLTAADPPLPLSPSIFLVDITDKNHPLRRTKATSSLLNYKENERNLDETQSNTGSWSSEVVDGCWWDAEYVQHWLKLDNSRLKEQQQQREMLQLEYDRTEIEEWTMSCDDDDVAKASGSVTRGIQPEVHETDFRKTHENSKGWSTAEIKQESEKLTWPYEGHEVAWQESSPPGSWSSRGANDSDECDFNDGSVAGESKDFSAAADETVEVSSSVGTDFTRDFYRLVKFESTKSLTSNSSKSNGKCELNSFNSKRAELAEEREMALQSVLSFIVEQQKYCHNREEQDDYLQSHTRPHSTAFETENSKFNKAENEDNYPMDVVRENTSRKASKIGADDLISDTATRTNTSSQASAPIRKKVEITINLSSNHRNSETISPNNDSLISKKNKIDSDKCYQRNSEKEIFTRLPVRNNSKSKTSNQIANSRNPVKIPKAETKAETFRSLEPRKSKLNEDFGSCLDRKKKSSLEIQKTCQRKADAEPASTSSTAPREPPRKISQKSWVPVKSFQRKYSETRIPVSVSEKLDATSPTKPQTSPTYLPPRPKTNPRVKGTRIPVFSTKRIESTSASKSDRSDVSLIPKKSSTVPEVPPTPKQLFADDESFHEKATMKDVIEELNKMIKKGEDVSPNNGDGELKPLDVACCCPTGWVHVERDIDFADPKARANLLDVMLASSGSSESSESSSESGGDEPIDYTHLHRLHRFRRQRKASATREPLGVFRYSLTSTARPSIIGRENFFVRFGDKEKEAVASFDFLEDISTTSVSRCSSSGSLGSNRSSGLKSALNSPVDQELPLSEMDLGTPLTPTTPGTPSDDSDERTGGPVSLSDSCADSYSESGASIEEICPNFGTGQPSPQREKF